jgi:Tfp pilus assembly protein FimT
MGFSLRRNNFALVELMLTLAVLAILAALTIPFFNRANQKGQYANWINQKNLFLSDGDLDL